MYLPEIDKQGTCSFVPCANDKKSKGLCRTHYAQQRRGEALRQIKPNLKGVPLEQRLRYYAPEGAPDECWEYKGGCQTNRGGYGKISIGGQGKTRGAHIVAWELANGMPMPEGLQIRHSCHNPPCTNPAHLSVGTAQDNADDKQAAGRYYRGEQHGRAKITEDDVRAIRRRYAAGGVFQRELAADYGIDQTVVSDIVRRKIWQHVED
ncbi:HNH endonuclease signature motif containing protein [Tsukamurella tyrosinosolvens]|uniref:HNH endonuclease signature motif containing protein n=1 Tax=Tsukamurella tyrosinosolvens TaxID=57704 RepID=UPI003462211B